MPTPADRAPGETTARTGGGTATSLTERSLWIQWVFSGACHSRQELDGPRLRIGRGPNCHIRLEHASVSREQAELHKEGPIYALQDLGSSNGTYLNGVRTAHVAIADGDVIRVGEYVGIVEALSRAAEPVAFMELLPGVWGGATLAAVLGTVRAAARSDVPFVIVGETGVGKERIARAIHVLSERPGRFHALNCSAVPEGLAEAELFGHQRGAYTGADRTRVGHFRAAHQGTLFLDEVSDLPPSVQAKVLRAVEEREVTPVGDTEGVPADVRIVAAAHEPLERFVEEKRFRSDLHARLAGFRLDVPPLRERRADIPGLFFHLVGEHGSGRRWDVDAKLVERLCLHDWPGNVRELELFARKLIALHGSETVFRRAHADSILGSKAEAEASNTLQRFKDRREHDLSRLRAALSEKPGNLSAAAASIGISRRRAYRLLSRTNGTEEGPDSDSGVEP